MKAKNKKKHSIRGAFLAEGRKKMARIDIEMNVKGNAIDSLEKIDKKIQSINKSLSETEKN